MLYYSSNDDHPRHGIGYDYDEVFNERFPEAQCDQSIYVLQSLLDKSFYKIGYSSSLGDRLERLEGQYSGADCIYEAKNPNAQALERDLHDRYKEYRLPQSEWFKLDADQVSELSQLMEEIDFEHCQAICRRITYFGARRITYLNHTPYGNYVTRKDISELSVKELQRVLAS